MPEKNSCPLPPPVNTATSHFSPRNVSIKSYLYRYEHVTRRACISFYSLETNINVLFLIKSYLRRPISKSTMFGLTITFL